MQLLVTAQASRELDIVLVGAFVVLREIAVGYYNILFNCDLSKNGSLTSSNSSRMSTALLRKSLEEADKAGLLYGSIRQRSAEWFTLSL